MKKLLCILMIVLMCCGCTSEKPQEEVFENRGQEFIQYLKDYKTRDKDRSKTEDSAEFDVFLDKIFVDSMSSSYSAMHSSVVDYKAFGITKPEVSWGTVEYGDLSYIQDYIDQLEELQSFDYDTLSYRQEYDYEALEYSLLETIAVSYYEKYSLAFSVGNDQLGNMVTVLTDFPFYNQESVDDYVVLLKDVDRCVDDLLVYTEHQAKEGILLTDYSIDYTQDYIDSFTEMGEDNAIAVAFIKAMDKCEFLTESQKNSYIDEVSKVVVDEVIPAFKKVSKEIEKYRGKTTDLDMALCKLDKDYAELVYMLAGSSNRDLNMVYRDAKDITGEMIQNFVDGIYNEDYSDYGEGYYAYLDYYNQPEAFLFNGYEAILLELQNSLTTMYPDLGDVDFDVDEMDPSSASGTTLAYYWQAPIDNLNQNIIRVNPNTLTDDVLQTFETLAHEGFPGHLYQHIYYHKTNPHNFRSTIGFSGYTEGYAVQAEIDCLQWLDFADDRAIDIAVGQDVSYFPMYAVMDIGINYLGWNEKLVARYLEQTMLYDADMAEEFISFLVAMPGTYCYYGLGYTNFHTLRNQTMEALGDQFDYAEYNHVILENGPLPFNILQGAVNDYIASKQ